MPLGVLRFLLRDVAAEYCSAGGNGDCFDQLGRDRRQCQCGARCEGGEDGADCLHERERPQYPFRRVV